jgi:hypothetical protein
MATSVSSAKYSSSNSSNILIGGRSIYRIIGIACLAGFLFDLLVLAAPPNPMELQWRIGFLQKVGDRSIVFMLGIAFLMMGIFDARALLKKLALGSMIVGLIFCLLVPLSIRDSVVLQKEVSGRINTQANQIENQIQQIQSNPELKNKPTEAQIKQALATLSTRSDSLQKNAAQGAIKTGAASVSNLLITGLALIGLGRYGMRR